MNDREPVEPTPRRAMPPARRARIFGKTNGVCAYPDCNEPAVEADHIVCLALGGRDEDDNCEGLCARHHAQKTARDRKMIAQAERRGKKDRGEWAHSKHKIKGRGFAPGRNRDFNRRFR